MGARNRADWLEAGAARSLAATVFPLEDVKRIAHSQGVTVNDVLLTICDAAVIRYFDDKGKAPDEPLVGYMPVNLRTREDNARAIAVRASRKRES